MESVLARLEVQWPSLAIAGFVAVMVLFLLKRVIPQRYGKCLNSVTWISQNLPLAIFLCWVLPTCVWAPFSEELLFRAPLLLLFDSPRSPYAWLGILISAILFGAGHRILGLMTNATFKALELHKAGAGDDIGHLMRLAGGTEEQKPSKRARLIRFMTAFLPGIAYGYIALAKQTIWITIVIHLLWNLVLPVVGIVIGIIVAVVVGTSQHTQESAAADMDDENGK